MNENNKYIYKWYKIIQHTTKQYALLPHSTNTSKCLGGLVELISTQHF